MYIYRPHCGALEESMEEVQEFETDNDLFEYLNWLYRDDKDIRYIYIDEDDNYPVNDIRTGWRDTCPIMVEDDFGKTSVVGWCATDYDLSVWEENKKNFYHS